MWFFNFSLVSLSNFDVFSSTSLFPVLFDISWWKLYDKSSFIKNFLFPSLNISTKSYMRQRKFLRVCSLFRLFEEQSIIKNQTFFSYFNAIRMKKFLSCSDVVNFAVIRDILNIFLSSTAFPRLKPERWWRIRCHLFSQFQMISHSESEMEIYEY